MPSFTNPNSVHDQTVTTLESTIAAIQAIGGGVQHSEDLPGKPVVFVDLGGMTDTTENSPATPCWRTWRASRNCAGWTWRERRSRMPACGTCAGLRIFVTSTSAGPQPPTLGCRIWPNWPNSSSSAWPTRSRPPPAWNNCAVCSSFAS